MKNFQNLIKKFINRDIYLNIKLARIVFNNRKALKSIKSFRSGTLISKSKDNYGLTKKGYDLVDKNINLRLTYMDIIPYLCNYIGNEIIYVEIGVSVLKNFYCIANNLTSIVINIYNLCIFFISLAKYDNSSTQLMLILTNIIIYICAYIYLYKYKKNFNYSN